MSMTSRNSARRRPRLGSHGAVLASAALGALVACSAGGGGTGNSNPTQNTAGASASSGGSSGAVASGGTAQSSAGATTMGGTGNGASGAAGAATTGGSSGTAGAGGASTLMLTMNAGKYEFAFGSTYFEVDPSYGARVTALRVGGATGSDLIASSAVTGDADNWGSTFWPSPQSSWTYPPTLTTSIANINSQPYTVVTDATSVTLTSATSVGAPMISVVKKFSVDLAKEAVIIDYTMQNQTATPVTVAPWEITRVASGGITFYAPGSGSPMPGNFPLPPASTITTAAGAVWYQNDATDAHDYKLFADGIGWLAHAAGNLLLVKSFPDVPAGKAATGEAEIEIYAAKSTKYNEVEQQGAVQTLTAKGSAGDSLHWTVRWFARKMATPAVVGSADLVAYVQNLIQ
jgi:hypothetical protein